MMILKVKEKNDIYQSMMLVSLLTIKNHLLFTILISRKLVFFSQKKFFIQF